MRKVVNNTAPVQLPIPPIDALERWVVRTESKRQDWDTVFQGAGDNLSTGILGDGECFLFDFSAPPEDPRWCACKDPDNYACQSIKWNFSTPVYVKEGTIYYYNTPKGTYADFYIASPQYYPYMKKTYDSNFNVIRTLASATQYTRFNQWVVHYHLEGNAPMGDELNTESAAEYPTYPFHIYEAVFTVPKVPNWQECHGHWSLEIFRPGTIKF